MYVCVLNIGDADLSINIPYLAPSFCMNKDNHKGRYHKQQSQDHQGAMYLQTTQPQFKEPKFLNLVQKHSYFCLSHEK